MVFPLVVALVAACFSTTLFRQYLSRRQPHQLVWSASLLLGTLAAVSFLLFLLTGRQALFFRLYYLFGGLLMAACLGLGSIYLLAQRRVANIVATAVGVVSVTGAALVFLAPLNRAALQGLNVEAGTRAISGPSITFLIVLNTFGAAAVIGGAGYSGWRLLQRQGPVRLLVANLLIAVGTLFASLAGTLARVTGNGSFFWLLLALGFVILFGGFLLTSWKRAPGRIKPLDSPP